MNNLQLFHTKFGNFQQFIKSEVIDKHTLNPAALNDLGLLMDATPSHFAMYFKNSIRGKDYREFIESLIIDTGLALTDVSKEVLIKAARYMEFFNEILK